MNALVGYKSSKFENCNHNDKPKVEVYDQEQYYMFLWLRTVSLAIVILSALKDEDVRFEHKY